MRRPRGIWIAWLSALTMMLVACGNDVSDVVTDVSDAATEVSEAAGDVITDASDALSDPDTTEMDSEEPSSELIGVTDDTITIGLLADQTGRFAPLVLDIVAAQEVYFDIVNENGGIDGRNVELEVVDTAYDVDQHRTQYEAIRDNVAMISQSTGSPHTAGVIDLMLEDDMVAIPLSWYSGWADPAFDESTVLEQQTNYCFEGMNVVEWLSNRFQEENGTAPTWAVISFPGEYGQDGAYGAKYAIDQLGLELVFDGEGLVTTDEADPETEVITGLIESAPDLVFATTNPGNLATIVGGAAQAGFQGQWTGSVPSYDFRLLDTPVAPVLDASYWQSAYGVSWNTDVPGMPELVAALTDRRPDLRPSDAFVLGWTESITTEAVLRAASESGDLSRAGIKAAALSIEGLAFDGLAADQSYAPSDDPNAFATRAISIFRPSLEEYNAAGGASQTIGSAPNGGTTGSQLVVQDFVGDVAAGYDFTERCFKG